MDKLTGYRTLIANGVAIVVAIGAAFGVVIPENESTAVTLGVMAVVGIVLRFLTTGPVGGGE